ncbi:MAG: Smr/MutS family protein [Bacteroidota bacterium]
MSEFKIGDRVSAIDDDINGVITKIDSNSVTVETADGFEMDFSLTEIIKNETLGNSIFQNASVEDVIQQKEHSKKPKSTRVKPKERNQPMMEVDLHIHQITTSHKGMTNHEMLNLQLDTARHKLEYAIKNRILKIVFIHGVGEGVLKMELEYLLGRYENIKFYDADYQKYGLGATEVYVFQNVKRV